MITVGSLFSGIGGFDLAARWMGWETKWYSEIEPYACRVMQTHFPEAVNLGDITQITKPPTVNVMVGGFPCQDISVAGKGEGIGGSRSGLWKHYARLIGEVSPQVVVIENSPMLRSRGLDVVLQDLLEIGYDAEWHCITAASVGAPHQRDRVWIVAYPKRTGLEGHPRYGPLFGEQGWFYPEPHGPTGSPCLLSGEYAQGRWKPEPNVGRVAHGVPSRVDRLRCLGNAVVPQVAYRIFQAIQSGGLLHSPE